MVTALQFFVLLTSVATGSSRVTRKLNALNVLDETYSTDLVVRNLRSNVAMATSDQAEERVSFTELFEDEASKVLGTVSSHFENDDGLTNVLKRRKLDDDGQPKWAGRSYPLSLIDNWIRAGKTETNVFFEELNLNIDDVGLLHTESFLLWAEFVLKKNGDNFESTYKSMYSFLSMRFSDNDALDKSLVAQLKFEDGRHFGGSFARGMLYSQLSRWVEEGKSAEDVFTLLKLSDAGEGFMEVRAFPLWVSFLQKIPKPKPEMNEYDLMLVFFRDNVSRDTLKSALSRPGSAHWLDILLKRLPDSGLMV